MCCCCGHPVGAAPLQQSLQVICVTIGYYASLTRAKAEGDHTGDVLFRPLGGFEAGAAALLVSAALRCSEAISCCFWQLRWALPPEAVDAEG